jgi:hypothetical protein
MKLGNSLPSSSQYIVGCYSRYFNDILILPFEILKDDEKKLWQTISKEFEVPLVTERMQKLNVSLDLKRVYILSKMNEMSRKAMNTLFNSNSYKNEREKQQITGRYKQAGKWVHRRFVEHARNKEINDMYKLFDIEDVPEDFLEFELPRELVKSIEKNYLDFLEGKIEEKYLRSYRKKFIRSLI